MITIWDTDNELFDEKDEDAMQLIDNVSAPIGCQFLGDSSDEDSNE